MKHLICLLLTCCLLFPAAFAEDGEAFSFRNTVGNWLKQAAENTSQWASKTWDETSDWASQAFDETSDWFSQAWGDASGWVSKAWGSASEQAAEAWNSAGQWIGGAWVDASEWAGKAWTDSSARLKEIWGDVSDKAAELYGSAAGSVGAWWAETFSTVAEPADDPWEWISEKAADPETRGLLREIRDAVSADDDTAGAKIRDVFDRLLERLGVSAEDGQKIWDSITVCAEQAGVDPLTADRLALAYLFRLATENPKPDGAVPAFAAAQYLAAAIGGLGIENSEDAAAFAAQLSAALEDALKE